jgi:hypothetical protein
MFSSLSYVATQEDGHRSSGRTERTDTTHQWQYLGFDRKEARLIQWKDSDVVCLILGERSRLF